MTNVPIAYVVFANRPNRLYWPPREKMITIFFTGFMGSGKTTIGKFIASLRNEKNLTQEQLAEKLHISSYKTISKWECGNALPDIETFEELSNYQDDVNFKIKEIPIIYKDRIEGSESKLNTYSDGVKVLKTIGKLFKEYRPFSFFGLLSLLFFVIGFVIGLPAYIGYFKTGLVMKFPSLIVSCFALTISLLLFIAGLILDMIVTKQKQDYELYLNQLEIINKEKLIKK